MFLLASKKMGCTFTGNRAVPPFFEAQGNDGIYDEGNHSFGLGTALYDLQNDAFGGLLSTGASAKKCEGLGKEDLERFRLRWTTLNPSLNDEETEAGPPVV